MQGVGPEIDRIDGEHAVQGFVGAGKTGNVSQLDGEPSLRYLLAEPALRLAYDVVGKIHARDVPAANEVGQPRQAVPAAKADL